MRRWLAVGLSGLLLAVGVPAFWWATRPSASMGPPVAAVVGRPAAAATGTATAPAPAPAPAGESVPAARSATVPALAAPSGPRRILIPRVGLDAPVVPAGVRRDGSNAMAIPEDVDEVGWYRFGPRPGDPRGSAVLAGHVDAGSQGRGAMFGVRELVVGDPVEVRLDDGRVVGYRVIAKETIVKKRLPVERLFARDGAPRLVLITCGGPFVAQLSSYRDNVVIVAEPNAAGG